MKAPLHSSSAILRPPKRSAKVKVGIALVAVALAGTAVGWWWMHGAPRRQALETLNVLQTALASSGSDALLNVLVVPASMRNRTASEQAEFIRKALRDEISPEGLAVLQREGRFGSLTNLFPAQAEIWSQQAGFDPGECVAFRLERHGLRAEVVLAKQPDAMAFPGRPAIHYRVVRVNNVKQMAETNLVATETHP